jgi:RNA polymerase sigma factor (sigma-70 family)
MVTGEGAAMTTGLRQVLEHLQQSGGGLSDGQLLGRFVGVRDEAAFAALVRRHGPMVLGVCRRVLGDFHDAEDAFQATFLVLARKAGSVVRRDSLGCWLYQVAYHTALEAGAAKARRRARERPMKDMPHPEVAPAEARDWRPLLDRELSRLPEKYRAAIVLCDLEGRTRKEVAGLLGLPEGTLSSRLAAGRQMLAKRLTACGVALSGGALAVALGQGTASAQVPAGLVNLTARAAALIAAGQAAAVSPPAVVLMKGVMRAMLLKKLRLGVGAVLVLAALGLVGFGYRAGGGPGAAQAAPPEKPRNELEALRKENDLLRLNLLVVLEKVRAQESEIRDLHARPAGSTSGPRLGGSSGTSLMGGGGLMGLSGGTGLGGALGLSGGSGFGGSPMGSGLGGSTGAPPSHVQSDPVKDAEAAVKALREAKDKEGRRKATEALDKAMKKLREQLK